MNIINTNNKPADDGVANLALVLDTMTEFDKVQAGVGALAAKYRGVAFPVATAKGLAEAKDARAEIRSPRYAVDKALKAAKAPLNALKKNLDERAQYITEQILQIEEPVHAQIRAEEERREQAKEAAARAEREKLEAITIKLAGIRAAANVMPGTKSGDVLGMIGTLDLAEPTEADYGDLLPAAQRAHAETLATLRQIHEAAVAHEAQQAEIARQQAAAKVEADRLAAERRAEEQRAAAERKIAQDKLDAERRAFEQQQAAARAEAAAIAKAAADKLAAERAAEEARAAAARREAEAVAQAERDKLAAEIAEFERVQAKARAEAAEAEKALRDAEAARLAEIARLAAAQAAALDRVQRAGPVLLAALERLVKELVDADDEGLIEHSETIIAARAAISLATGA